jgi:hypothetical protein
MNVRQELDELRTISPGAAAIAWEVEQVEQAFAAEQINQDERAYLLQEIMDIKAANVLANEENALRLAVAAINILLAAA